VFCGADVDFIIGGQLPLIPDFRPRLKSLKAPLMVLAGRYDRALYPKLQQQFLDFAPQAQLRIMERSGSFAHIEEPAVVFEAVRTFWRAAA
jgi:proline iminopeptidase